MSSVCSDQLRVRQHDPRLRRRRRANVTRRRSHDRAQLALGLKCRRPPVSVSSMPAPEGLLAALADLLLSALGAEAITTEGSGDEHQDHA